MARKFLQDESLILPPDLDYSKVQGISTEERQALERVRPVSVGMARRIEGVTPAGALRLLMHVRRAMDASKESSLDADALEGSAESVLRGSV